MEGEGDGHGDGDGECENEESEDEASFDPEGPALAADRAPGSSGTLR